MHVGHNPNAQGDGMNDQERIESNRAHRYDSTVTVLSNLKAQLPEVHAQNARVVGRWVWVEFEARPDEHTRETLSALGFHWNRARAAWQHCGGWAARHAPYDPRIKYGEVRAAELETVTA